jgi:uncharacterized membrane protein
MTWDLFQIAFLAILPLVEQRLAIPVGYFSFHLPIVWVTFVAILSNIISVAIVLWLLPRITQLCEKHSPPFHRFLEKIYAKTHTKHSNNIKIWGELFLIFFVAIPIPGSGGWTGALIAFLFGIRYRLAIKLISIGLIIGGIFIASLTVGANEMITLFRDIPEEIIEFAPTVLP